MTLPKHMLKPRPEHEAVSAKRRPKKSKKDQPEAIPDWRSGHETDESMVSADESSMLEPHRYPHLDKKYTRNDRVIYDDKVWVCRKTHWAADASGPPEQEQALWKEA